ncbi:enolase-phosphatase E1 isoform X3 [Embiotoca jacksoni]|uniref:enolase-phosphatase E1 isoform X3 n=1 Tax=Embiotoca jacksoni TaxID=100190 RepID=UPI003703CB08
MGTQGAGRKRSTKKERSTAEDDALNLIAREAEAKLAAKRAARAEAREIRMKELERQQKEIFQVQKKYYGLNTKVDDRVDNKWGDIEQWMEDSERYSRSSRIQTLSDEDERMSVGSRGSVRSDVDAVGAYGGGGSSLHKKSKKKKKHKHKDRDRNGCDDDYSVVSSRSSRLSDESRASRSSRLDLTSSRLSDDNRVSRASRLDLQPASYASSDLYSLNGLSSSRNPGSTFNGYQPLQFTSYRSSGSRASSRASSARASPVDNCGSVASYLRSTAGSSGLPRDLDDVTIPDFPDVSRFAPAGGRGRDVEDKDYLEKGSRAASALTAGTLTSIGGTSSRRGSGETAITVDAESSIREIKDALAEVEEKYRKAMVSNAQLDNEKNNLMYQVDTLKDSLMELEELLSESRREYEEKVKDYDREKHAHGVLQFQFNEMKEMLKQSEELLNEIRQLRMKQEGFVREISDLQETVEWKDKKIGALERQKEYTDAIRIERDELREEVVKLKDILKKHGIVLGPDLSINGDFGEAEVDGSPGADPASPSVKDPQTSPAEGNSMLGNTEELSSSREEEVDPEQPQEKHEEAKENHLSSDALCNVADVSKLETSSEGPPQEEQQATTSGLNKDFNVDINDCPITEAKDIIVELQRVQPVTSPEDNVPETDMSEGGDLKETSYTDLEETQTKSSCVDTDEDLRKTCTSFSEDQEDKQDVEESTLTNTESCPQQRVAHVVMTESLAHESVPAAPKTGPQQEPENGEDAENEEAEEMPSKSAGKKKKKKRRGKKKGATHEKNQQKDGTDKDAAAGRNGTPTEPNIDGSTDRTIKEPKVDQVENEQGKKETEEAEPTETFSQQEPLKEPRPDHVSNERHEEQILETKTSQEEMPFETPHHPKTPNEVRADHDVDKQDEEETLETENIETLETENIETETFSHVETLEEYTTDSRKDENDCEQTLETEKVEETVTLGPDPDVRICPSGINSDSSEGTGGLDKECAARVDNSSREVIHSQSEMVEVESESSTNNPENSVEISSKENTEAESHVPNNSESKDDAFVAPPSPDDSAEDPLTEVSHKGPEEAVPDDGEPRAEAEQEVSPTGVEPPGRHGENSEPRRDGTGGEEPNGDKKEPGDVVELDSFSHDERGDGDGAPLTKNPEASDAEKDDAKTSECTDQIDGANAENEEDPVDVLDATNFPKEETEIGSFVEKESEDPEQKSSQGDEETESSLCPTAEETLESSEDKSDNRDSPRPNLLNSDDEDGEDEEGPSFDFDDMDVEAAAEVSNPPTSPELEGVEEGVEVESDECISSGLWQNNSDENTKDKPAESNDEKRSVDGGNRTDGLEKEPDTGPQENSSTCEEAASENVRDEQRNASEEERGVADESRRTAEEGEGLNVGENVDRRKYSAVEDGLDAVRIELQGNDSTETADKEAPKSGRDARKGSKKGKGKGKEDCKMS